MNPIQTLMEEHRRIERMLMCLDRMVNMAKAGEALDTAAARQALDFFRNYADKVHHAKEEDRLFPELEAHGMPATQGPTAVMRHEHEIGRAAIAAMASALDAIEGGDAEAVADFNVNAEAYIALLSAHIHKEDHCLFPMTGEYLSPADVDRLVDSFEQADREETGVETIQKYEQLVDEFCERFGVGDPAAAECGEGESCCG